MMKLAHVFNLHHSRTNISSNFICSSESSCEISGSLNVKGGKLIFLHCLFVLLMEAKVRGQEVMGSGPVLFSDSCLLSCRIHEQRPGER